MDTNAHSLSFLILLFPFLVHTQGMSGMNTPKATGATHGQSWNYRVTIVVIVLHGTPCFLLKQEDMTGDLPGLELPVEVMRFLLGPRGHRDPLSTHCPSPPVARARTERKPTIKGGIPASESRYMYLHLLKPLPQGLLKTSRVSHCVWAVAPATVLPATLLDTVPSLLAALD